MLVTVLLIHRFLAAGRWELPSPNSVQVAVGISSFVVLAIDSRAAFSKANAVRLALLLTLTVLTGLTEAHQLSGSPLKWMDGCAISTISAALVAFDVLWLLGNATRTLQHAFLVLFKCFKSARALVQDFAKVKRLSNLYSPFLVCVLVMYTTPYNTDGDLVDAFLQRNTTAFIRASALSLCLDVMIGNLRYSVLYMVKLFYLVGLCLNPFQPGDYTTLHSQALVFFFEVWLCRAELNSPWNVIDHDVEYYRKVSPPPPPPPPAPIKPYKRRCCYSKEMPLPICLDDSFRETLLPLPLPSDHPPLSAAAINKDINPTDSPLEDHGSPSELEEPVVIEHASVREASISCCDGDDDTNFTPTTIMDEEEQVTEMDCDDDDVPVLVEEQSVAAPGPIDADANEEFNIMYPHHDEVLLQQDLLPNDNVQGSPPSQPLINLDLQEDCAFINSFTAHHQERQVSKVEPTVEVLNDVPVPAIADGFVEVIPDPQADHGDDTRLTCEHKNPPELFQIEMHAKPSFTPSVKVLSARTLRCSPRLMARLVDHDVVQAASQLMSFRAVLPTAAVKQTHPTTVAVADAVPVATKCRRVKKRNPKKSKKANAAAVDSRPISAPISAPKTKRARKNWNPNQPVRRSPRFLMTIANTSNTDASEAFPEVNVGAAPTIDRVHASPMIAFGVEAAFQVETLVEANEHPSTDTISSAASIADDNVQLSPIDTTVVETPETSPVDATTATTIIAAVPALIDPNETTDLADEQCPVDTFAYDTTAFSAAAESSPIESTAANAQPFSMDTTVVTELALTDATSASSKPSPIKTTENSKSQPNIALRSVLRPSKYGPPSVDHSLLRNCDVNAELLGDWESFPDSCPHLSLGEAAIYQLKQNHYWKRKVLSVPRDAVLIPDAMDVLTLECNLRNQLIPDTAILEDVEVQIKENGTSGLVSTYAKQSKVFQWFRMILDGKGRQSRGVRRVRFQEGH